MGAGENLECRYVVSFLKEHGREVYTEVRAAYIDTMNKVIFFRTYHVFVIDFSMTETFKIVSIVQISWVTYSVICEFYYGSLFIIFRKFLFSLYS